MASMRTLPSDVQAYSRTPEYTELTVPKGLLKDHRTKPGVWGRIVVEAGSLHYHMGETGEEIELSPQLDGVVEPEAVHHVSPHGRVRFWVEFLKQVSSPVGQK